MIPKFTIHAHTNRSHADNSAEEMILSAIKLGCPAIGISEHSYIDEGNKRWTLFKDEEFEYVNEILALRDKYKDKIDIFLGLEQDSRSPMYKYDNYDYVIGSMHSIPYPDEIFRIDESRASFMGQTLDRFNGDYYKVCEDYYDMLCNIVDLTNCSVIGHFDIVTKFNEDNAIFDIEHPRYVKAYTKALDALCEKDVVFEVNTGAIPRGHRKTPYPSIPILKELNRRGCKITVTSDTHNKDTILFWFDEVEEFIKSCGFKSVMAFTKNGFEEVKI